MKAYQKKLMRKTKSNETAKLSHYIYLVSEVHILFLIWHAHFFSLIHFGATLIKAVARCSSV